MIRSNPNLLFCSHPGVRAVLDGDVTPFFDGADFFGDGLPFSGMLQGFFGEPGAIRKAYFALWFNRLRL